MTLQPEQENAIAAWRECLGEEHVDASTQAVERFATATFATRSRPIAILRPASRDEVARCLRIAAEHRVPVYPVSGGKNWGYGSAVPTRDGCAVLDLGRLNRIVHFDEELAYVTVEPGVTFRQLFEFLQARTKRLFVSVPGASPDASVIGNALERGDGTGPHGDRFAHVCGMEVVLAGGEIVRTGHARFDRARTGAVSRWGVGPALDGLFTQSNLGVVTQMTVWLTSYPASLQLGVMTIGRAEQIPALVNALRQLRLEGTLRTAAGLWNGYKIAASIARYPFDALGGATPLPEEHLRAMLENAAAGRWMGLVSIYGASKKQAMADRERVEEVLRDRVDTLAWDERTPEDFADLARRGGALGVPHELSTASMYWRKRSLAVPSRIDPHADRCGFIWCTPTVPLDGEQVAAVAALCEEIVFRHGFEPQVALLAVTERLVYVAASIVYDRDVPGEDARAMACHDELFAKLLERGYYPCRLGLQSMELLPRADDDGAAVIARIRRELDPHGILAPGRYER
jgi:4-cresol dehydrogenase (hydroxylating)